MSHPLQIYREKTGLSQEELAARLGVTRQMISFIETGERRVTPEKALKWAKLIPISKGKLCPEIFGKAAA